ncbi:NAD-dependent epimerase/dehydratase family protein [Xanthobacteraceae bacterium Astr-EGSB]|uniref:NAD-dependent epimerase/dehydratase family protein n=1 Tax=Astrobacterium formosum TaxID=3069710 RepID=UPI0027B00B1F|nr:NAD-dependent epimerase/dehydratase family protein [Xanthobacteraceae bacterium Astr-EGSB]
MRVLVTGATGFVGRPLLVALQAAEHEVHAAVRRPPRLPLPAGIEVVPAPDLGETGDWRTVLDGVDAVVHLAGIAHVGADIAEARYDLVNHQASAALALAAVQAGIGRFVFVSSIRAQCRPVATHPLSEGDPPRPTDAYGRSKLAAEADILASGIGATILRPVAMYGPGMKGNFDTLARLARLPVPLPFGSLRNRRSLLSVAAMADAVVFTLETAATIGGTYIVADAVPVTLVDIIAALRSAAGRPRRLFHLPAAVFRTAARLIGRSDLWDRLDGELIASPARLAAFGWRPEPDTCAALARAVHLFQSERLAFQKGPGAA